MLSTNDPSPYSPVAEIPMRWSPAFVGLLVISSCTPQTTPEDTGATAASELQSLLEEGVTQGIPGIQGAVATSEGIVWSGVAGMADLQAGTNQETHSIEIDYNIFEDLSPPDVSNYYAVYHAMDLNFQLKPDGPTIDAGEVIPTVNDDFVGKGPDLGAHEAGATEMKYGPRWLTWQPFYR